MNTRRSYAEYCGPWPIEENGDQVAYNKICCMINESFLGSWFINIKSLLLSFVRSCAVSIESPLELESETMKDRQ